MISMPEVGLTEAADPDLAVSAGAAGAAGTEGVMGLMTVEVAATLVGLTTSESLLTMAALANSGVRKYLASSGSALSGSTGMLKKPWMARL